jgi:predicted transcriptional regulator
MNKEIIINYIKDKKQATPYEIAGFLQIGRAMIHRHLKKLLETGILEKKGQAPKVIYTIKEI